MSKSLWATDWATRALRPADAVIERFEKAHRNQTSMTRMVSGQALDVVQAFAPFDVDETKRLRRYRDRCKKVSECSFLTKTLGFDVNSREGKVRSEIDHAGIEGRSHYLMMLRPLHAPGEEIGFPQVAAMLREHAERKGGDAASQTLEWIGEYERDRGEIKESGSLEIRESGGAHVVKPGLVFDTWLSGEDFHVDSDKADIIERVELPAVYEFVYLHVALKLGELYLGFGSFASSILHRPELIDTAR
jgi:hypothetical protein